MDEALRTRLIAAYCAASAASVCLALHQLHDGVHLRPNDAELMDARSTEQAALSRWAFINDQPTPLFGDDYEDLVQSARAFLTTHIQELDPLLEQIGAV